MRPTILAFLAFSLLATSARADDGESWFISGDFSLSIEHYSQSQSNSSITLVTIKPSLDYLLAGSHVTIGGQFALEHGEASNGGGSGTSYGFFGRVGYIALFGGRGGVWLHGGLGWEHGETELGPLLAALSNSSSPNFITLNLTAQFLYFPVPHLFFGAGPVFNTQLFTDADSASKLTSFGLESIIGGYF
jgi:hypothetical protein